VTASKRARCFVTRVIPGDAVERLKQAHDVDVWPDRLPPPPEELAKRTAEVEGLLSQPTDRIDSELMDRAPQLRAISNYAVGYDNIDVDAATKRGIPVGHTPDVLTEATADLAFALLLAAARKLVEAIDVVREGDWLTMETARHLGVELNGSTLAIIGFGRIGRAVGRRAEGFNMRVLHTRSGEEQSPEALLEDSDFVSLHCPLTPRTRHLIDADALKRMRSTAILINTARGPIVDHKALRQALIDGTIAGAALDVTDPEPLPADHPLLSAPNLIVTPHIGSATTVARERMADLAVDNLLAGLDGRPLPYQVSPRR